MSKTSSCFLFYCETCTAFKVIQRLIRHQLALQNVVEMDHDAEYENTYPEYINSCFDQMVRSRKEIAINIHWLNRSYPKLKQLCFHSKCPSLPLFNVIGCIFYRAHTLTISMDATSSDRELTSEYFDCLSREIGELNKVLISKLRKIRICGARRIWGKLRKRATSKTFIDSMKWNLKIMDHAQRDECELTLTRWRRKQRSKGRMLIDSKINENND